ncbi:carboxypeptidase-like regulatory domain-containing protein [Siphonobacter sp. SORGH_AS_0500]|uniref:carboxypeptidase-like regulatory domain-containing protein n=1 Tax=Siphonobacter sp. SORGH_AS_0500 TaxID=1864824 RepID=UPI002858B252|nr:carboxypeptidase-like regulatory domain-containing protein [Siphonobacter sp. SORGH_AS_0500]MDR6194167.1 hypothetical protein [Siphonobacter sp. SORGH_AS_0500]
MKYLFTLLFCCFIHSLGAQDQILKGRVLDEKTNEPVAFASVFISTTTTGTLTNEKGEFSLSVKAGNYEVIVSMVGYEPLVYALDTRQKRAVSYLFKIQPKTYSLQTVGVKAKRDSSWYDNLKIFKEQFLGSSETAQQCRILNENQLVIVFDPQTAFLEVKSDEVLKIENRELGYRINYLLAEFKYDMRQGYVTYLGYPNFQLMEGNKSRQRRWAKNRQRAYKGSIMHFVRSLRNQQLEAEGFNLRRLIRMLNPNRPTEEELKAIRQKIREQGGLRKDDPLEKILAKASLPKILEKLDTARVAYDEYLKNDQLTFEGFFQVVYVGEKEEPTYVMSQSRHRNRQPMFQTSVFSLRTESVLLEENGSILPPLGVMFEGYWGWEKVGDLLPLDYSDQ